MPSEKTGRENLVIACQATIESCRVVYCDTFSPFRRDRKHDCGRHNRRYGSPSGERWDLQTDELEIYYRISANSICDEILDSRIKLGSHGETAERFGTSFARLTTSRYPTTRVREFSRWGAVNRSAGRRRVVVRVDADRQIRVCQH